MSVYMYLNFANHVHIISIYPDMYIYDVLFSLIFKTDYRRTGNIGGKNIWRFWAFSGSFHFGSWPA